MVALAIVSDLHKTADMARPGALQKEGCRLRELEIAVVSPGLRGFGSRKRSIQDYGKRERLKEVQRCVVLFFVITYFGFRGECIALQLEGSSERCQLGWSVVAGSARKACLPRIARNGLCTRHGESNQRYDRKNFQKDSA